MRTRTPLSYLITVALLLLLAALMLAGCGGTTATTQTTVATTQSTAAGGPGGAAAVRFVMNLSGDESVPPVTSSASGTFTLFVEGGPSPTGQPRISWELDVTGIVDVSAAHIHLGAKGTAGPVVVPLFTGPVKAGSFSGVLAQGSIAGTDLTGPMSGKTLSDLLAAMQAGDTYVNVHTKAFPNGEIRGQIVMSQGSATTETTAAGGGSTTSSSSYGY
jgi:hypothetical protein